MMFANGEGKCSPVFQLLFQVYANDGLPAQACARCVEKVEQWFEFKGVCVRSDERLRQLIIKREVRVSLLSSNTFSIPACEN